MSKNRRALVVLTTVGVVASFCFLLFVYHESFCSLFKEFLTATMTGCLVAIPSGVVLLIEENKKLKIKRNQLIANIEETVNCITISDFTHYSADENEIYRKELVRYYHELVQDYNENIWADAEDVSLLTMSMFHLSLCIKELNEIVNSTQVITPGVFEKKARDIVFSQRQCSRYIKKNKCVIRQWLKFMAIEMRPKLGRISFLYKENHQPSWWFQKTLAMPRIKYPSEARNHY